jgi:hypothetical protein
LINGPVWAFDAATKAYVAATSLNALAGYWVYASYATTVAVNGVPPASGVVTLTAGWNLVGPAADVGLPVDPAIVGSFIWNGAAETFLSSTTLQQGRGYWILVTGTVKLDTATGTVVP